MYWFEDNCELPEYMKNDKAKALAIIRENAYDYESVDRNLAEATKKMLVKSMKNMNPRVVRVNPNLDYSLLLTFSNQVRRIFDMKKYLNIGIFKELKRHRILYDS